MGKDTKGDVIGTVVYKDFVTPHYIRVHLRVDEGFEDLLQTTVGDNNKILIPPEGTTEIYWPQWDSSQGKWQHADTPYAPTIRTYTHRGLCIEKKELIIDFVNHGDQGPASRWALHCQKGDKLGIMMRTEPRVLYSLAEQYLLAGDATALPVIACILEGLPKSASGYCILEVHSPKDVQVLNTNANFRFKWLFNENPLQGSSLAQEVRNSPLCGENKFAFVAGESATVKKIRNYFRKELGWQQDEISAYAYWKAGRPETKP